MAKFSQQFLANLGRPEMAESLFGLGAAIGGLPGQVKEQRRKQEQLNRYDQIAQMSEQGIASAQSGDVANVTSRIEQLQQARENAKTLEEKQSIEQSILKLQSLLPGAKQVAIGNNAKELVNIEQKLKSLPTGSTPQRLALQKRQEVLQQDPEAMEQFQQYQLNTWRFQQEGEKIKEEQWLDTNRGAILEAVQNGDTKALNSVIEGAGEYAEAAQKFADSSLRSAETMAQFEENSIERKMAPSVDYYVEQVDNLPEEIGQNLKTTLAAYKAVSEKGWDGKQWTAGLRTRAKQLERELQGQLRAINSQIATSEYFEAKREDRATKEQIKKIEIKLDAPMGSDYIKQGRIMAQSLLKKGDELTQNDIMTQATALYERDRRQLIQELASLTGEEPVEEEEEEEEKYEDWQLEVIKKAMDANPNRSKKEVINALNKRGDLSSEAKTSEPTEREERMKALGPRDERMDAIGTGFVARTNALGPREERMKSLGPREERIVSLFN
jgi:hypothetical protein